MRVVLVSLAAAALAVATACDPYYAPPVRAVQYGAPARLEEGRVEVGATAGGFAIPNVLGPHLGIGIRDWVALEGGGNFLIGGNQSWALGFVGPRFSLAPHREERVHFIGDLELGIGAGLGGVRDGNACQSRSSSDCDGLSGLDRTALGGYAGFGIGAQIGLLSLYGRARAEVSKATNVPTTVWPSMSVGAELNIKKRAAINLGFGYIGYVNARDQTHGWFYQIGLVFFIDAWGRHGAAPAAPTMSAPPPTPPRPPIVIPPAPPPDVEDEDEPMPDDEARDESSDS